MTSDIVQRLRDRAKFNTAVSPYNLLLDAAEELEAADKAEAMMRDEITSLRKRCAELEAAITEILDPISGMRARMNVADGEALNGPMAIVLSNNPNYLKEIARAAIIPKPPEPAPVENGREGE